MLANQRVAFRIPQCRKAANGGSNSRGVPERLDAAVRVIGSLRESAIFNGLDRTA